MPAAMYTVIVVFSYSFILDTEGKPFTRIDEIIRIPGIYYLILIIGWLIIVAITKIQRVISTKKSRTTAPSTQELEDETPVPNQMSKLKEGVTLGAVILTFSFCVFLSFLLEYLDLQMDIFILTTVYCFVFMLFAAIFGSFLMKVVIPLGNITKH